MRKSDKSIRNITVAKIKRSLMQNAVCKYTKTFESESMADLYIEEKALDEELPVAWTFKDRSNYTIVTTRRVITQKEGFGYAAFFQDIQSFKPGDFKGMADATTTIGSVTSTDGEAIPVFTETGKPAMVIVNAIGTIMNLTEGLTP